MRSSALEDASSAVACLIGHALESAEANGAVADTDGCRILKEGLSGFLEQDAPLGRQTGCCLLVRVVALDKLPADLDAELLLDCGRDNRRGVETCQGLHDVGFHLIGEFRFSHGRVKVQSNGGSR